MRTRFLVLCVALISILGLLLLFTGTLTASAAPTFTNPAFANVWTRTDSLIANGTVSRSYLWGPAANTGGILEDYAQALSGKRLVQYFDKSRMEITNPNGDKTSAYYVTNGLLVKELITGNMQTGDNTFVPRVAADIPVAGDPTDQLGPRYATLAGLLAPVAKNTGPVNVVIQRAGVKTPPQTTPDTHGATYAYFVAETGHNIASPFWTYLNQTGLLRSNNQSVTGRLFEPVFYATGFPITEAYWGQFMVAGSAHQVLIQAFERRILTYQPDAPAAYQVQMGNVGQHYYTWRYGTSAPVTVPPVLPSVTPTHIPGPPPVAASGCLPATSTNGAQACMSDPKPAQYGVETVYGRLILNGQLVSGATMNTTWNYKLTKPTCNGGITRNDGIATCTRSIGGASRGFTVVINVMLSYGGQSYATTTSFTTQ